MAAEPAEVVAGHISNVKTIQDAMSHTRDAQNVLAVQVRLSSSSYRSDDDSERRQDTYDGQADQDLLVIDGQEVFLRARSCSLESIGDSVITLGADTADLPPDLIYDLPPTPRPYPSPRFSSSLPHVESELYDDSMAPREVAPTRPTLPIPRLYVIQATCPPRRERLKRFSPIPSFHSSTKVLPGPDFARLRSSDSADGLVSGTSEPQSVCRPTKLWKTMRKRVLRMLRFTNPTRRRSAGSPKSVTDGLHLPKPPLLPRQNSSPLGSLPAPPRPRAHKPLKSSSTSSSCCSGSTGVPSSPSTPSLQRATPAPSSEKSYDSLSLNSLVNRPLPPVPTGENVYADVNFIPPVKAPHRLSIYPWFHDVEREDVDRMLKEVGEQGCFLVRISRRGGPSNPFTLSLLHEERVFHLNIRKRPDGSFALGSSKPREKTFATVSELIDYHRQEEILLTSRNQPAGSTRLTQTYHDDSRENVEKSSIGW